MANDVASDYSWEVKANDIQYHEKIKKPGFLCFWKKKYCGNRIKTSKYNFFTFIPLNLYEQFQKAQVIYFTCILILQSIPEIATLPVYSAAAPLLCILAARAFRDLFNDIARHKNDNMINNASSDILRDQRLNRMKWKDVRVGDIVCVNKDEFVPKFENACLCDFCNLGIIICMKVIDTEPESLCYIETAGIDGETNLKFRQALTVTHSSLNTLEALAAFDGLVTCEAPNAQIYSFVGVLEWKGQKYALNSENLLLRDCRIRNTTCCYGLVLYAGFDTKIMKNSGKIFLKWTKMDYLINKTVLCIAVFVISISFVLGIGAGIWDSLYLQKHYYIPRHPQYSSATFGALVFMGYLATIATLVPFFLYISLEVLHILHNFFIINDLEMYHEETDTPAQARGSSFCDMLGQIEYLFTDKTGTLTQNIMTFKKCCIGQRIFGILSSDEQQHKEVMFDWNQYADTSFRFYDQSLIDELHELPQDPLLHEFFRAVALCHTVMADDEKGFVKYKATSPDEEALVTAARNFGYAFLTRTQDSITISEMGAIKTYSILALMDFNSFRKRMSILVRNEEGKVKLYSKGADDVILERVCTDCQTEFLKEALNHFAEETLRTLCLACKEVEEQDYLTWEKNRNEASLTLENRQAHLENILGATAIEDKLQEGVPETIQLLKDGNIKVWMLTGDKKETAINIAYSCNLLSSNMQLLDESDIRCLLDANLLNDNIDTTLKDIDPAVDKEWNMKALVITGEFLTAINIAYSCNLLSSNMQLLDESDIRCLLDANLLNDNIDTTLKDIDPAVDKEWNMKALVITGEFLNGFINVNEKTSSTLPWWKKLISKQKKEHLADRNSTLKTRALVELACRCQCVICCRVTPKQKANIVQLVKTNKKVTTLAIGDGGNDVNMIKTAHIGVGVIGKEGLQAVLASEFALAQFSYLQNLLFFHGRLSYARFSKFLCYYNYKTFSSLVHNIWFAFFNGFTSLPVFDAWFLVFNAILYTLYPSLCMGILDKDTDGKGSRQHPELYMTGQKDRHLGLRIFVHVLYGFYTSLVMFFVSYFAFFDSAGPHGIFDYQVFAFTMSSINVLAVLAEAGENVCASYEANPYHPTPRKCNFGCQA
ncbi:PREDICTED: phospholipid-transporting ATPase IK-like [Nanorana parkeri]|uniref:phospholipid-transporting ATPase IK-like n=1 Tax=Nanorana parkeri TaxID=125878 RepID=UPI000854AD2F|nr:PREDICTED: phospholipid-transporting ATPase IK-like [Nanorana parkeri]